MLRLRKNNHFRPQDFSLIQKYKKLLKTDGHLKLKSRFATKIDPSKIVFWYI